MVFLLISASPPALIPRIGTFSNESSRLALDSDFDSPIHPTPMASEGTMLVKKAVGSHRGKQNRSERQQDSQKNEEPCSVTKLDLIGLGRHMER